MFRTSGLLGNSSPEVEDLKDYCGWEPPRLGVSNVLPYLVKRENQNSQFIMKYL